MLVVSETGALGTVASTVFRGLLQHLIKLWTGVFGTAVQVTVKFVFCSAALS